jgi:heme oxygenase
MHKNGLKKIHANFDSIYHKLERAYNQHKDNHIVTGMLIKQYQYQNHADIPLE